MKDVLYMIISFLIIFCLFTFLGFESVIGFLIGTLYTLIRILIDRTYRK